MSSLSRIRFLADTVAQLEADIAAEVSYLHNECGSSWAAIGSALGVTRQAAQQRYGGK